MKAFIFVALVASVAARSLDLDTLRLIKEKSLLNTRPVVDDVLLKEKLINQFPLDKTIVGDVVDKVYPVEDTTFSHGIKGIYDDVDRVLTIDELTNTVLFREYLRLPLFRQYIQYPAFQRFVASIYFQRFWQIPTYKQYFYNPVLFYKYVYPLVQLFTNEYTSPINQHVYGQQDVYSQDILGLQGLVDEVMYKNKNALPYVYNNQYGLNTNNRFAGQYLPYATETTNYKFLLDKIYKTLFVNQPVVGDLTQVKTDVKILSGDKKFVVEPITGERKLIVEEPKIVDVKVDQKIVPVESLIDTVVPVEKKTFDDVLITDRHVLLLKVLLKENVITPEIYEAVIRGQIEYSTLLREIYGQHVILTDRDVLLVKILLKKSIITPQVYEAVIRGQIDLFTVLRQVFGQQVTTIVDRDVLLLKVLLKENVITPEIYEAVIRGQIDLTTVFRQLFGQYVDIYDIVNQIFTRREVNENIFNIPTVNRFDSFVGNDRLALLNKMYKQKSLYNTEIPTLRENLFERLPLQNILGNLVN